MDRKFLIALAIACAAVAATPMPAQAAAAPSVAPERGAETVIADDRLERR